MPDRFVFDNKKTFSTVQTTVVQRRGGSVGSAEEAVSTTKGSKHSGPMHQPTGRNQHYGLWLYLKSQEMKRQW